MSDHTEPHESLHLTVVSESAKNYRLYQRKRRETAEEHSMISKLRKLLAEDKEEIEQSSDHRDTLGFN